MSVNRRIWIVVACGLLSACGTTALAPAAQSVRVISEEQAKACKFIDSVSANNESSLAAHPEQDARNKAMNRVAARGGNALVIKSTINQPPPSGIGNFFSLSGEAYLCSSVG